MEANETACSVFVAAALIVSESSSNQSERTENLMAVKPFPTRVTGIAAMVRAMAMIASTSSAVGRE